jgi:succinyl-CoA synthetase beta subunit
MVAEKVKIKKEFYLAIMLDRLSNVRIIAINFSRMDLLSIILIILI